MWKELSNYSLWQIIFLIIVLGSSVKGLVGFYDWGKDRLKKIFDKEYSSANERTALQSKILNLEKQDSETIAILDRLTKELATNTQNIQLLLNSDRDSIKSFITEKHHFFCYQQKWIDDYSLECINKRYEHYKREGGNSFIDKFMDDIRTLPIGGPEGQI